MQKKKKKLKPWQFVPLQQKQSSRQTFAIWAVEHRCVDRSLMSAQSVSSALAITLQTTNKIPSCLKCVPHAQNQS